MKTIRDKENTPFFRNACIIMIWVIVFYSSIVQYKYIEIPHGMMIFGGLILLLFYLANSGKPFSLYESITQENIYMLCFMVYILVIGLLFSPDRDGHLSQWITSLEYLFIQIVIASFIQNSGTETFHKLLLTVAIAIACIFIIDPVEYGLSKRFSISEEVNPNGLGLGFVAGIWAVLYSQHKSRQPLIFTGAVVSLLGYCILLTGSRKSLICAGLTVFLWLFFCFIPSLRNKGAWRGTITLLIMLILVSIIGYEFVKMYENTTIAERMNGLIYEASEGHRSDMYYEGYELLKQYPLFGIGFQGFKHYYGLYSHATIVEIPVSGGIIGALLYFSIYCISIKKAIRIYRITRKDPNLSLAHIKIKLLLILWIVMIFNTICIIHPYQFDSSILFGVIFGETAYIEKTIKSKEEMHEIISTRSRYLKYE